MNRLSLAKEKISVGARLTREEILALYEDNDLLYLAESARRVKERKTGKKIFYTVNRHINLTNVCSANCPLCAYRCQSGDKRAFTLAIGKRVLNSELIPNGKIPVFSANVLEPFGYVNKLLKGFEDFTSASVMWGIDGDFMVSFLPQNIPFYPTDHCGVLRVLTEKVHPRYAARILEREGRSFGFSRSNRASLDRVGRITFNVPSIEVQTKAMTEVLQLEEEIAQAKIELEGLSGNKGAILKKYLL